LKLHILAKLNTRNSVNATLNCLIFVSRIV